MSDTSLIALIALSAAGVVGGIVLGLVAFAARTARRVEATLPPTGRFVDVDGARIHYVERGAGATTLLLIHGLAGNTRHFTYALMDRLADDFRVVAIDRPGAGYSTRAPGAHAGPRAQAATVAGVIRALGLERPVLVGHSLGGAVALATALDHPDVVSGLALVAPLTQQMREAPDMLAALVVESPRRRALIAWTAATPVSILRSRATLAAIFDPEPVPPDFATAAGGMLGLRPSAFISASSDLVAAPEDMPSLVERYHTLRVPVGILYGIGDRVLDPRVHGEWTHAQRPPRFRLELMEGGHMLPLTAPERVAEFVRGIAREASEARGEARVQSARV